jgi:hypothetical protein
MPDAEGNDLPIWAASKARKTIDIVGEATKTIVDSDRTRANQPIGSLTEADLEAEQLRLEEMLHAGTMTVDDFCRLREVDHYLEGMRLRRHYGPILESE